MKLAVLGCSGGIGSGLKTTSMLVNDQWLIDAGTGIETLTHDQLKGLKGVFLTHAHMDHICCLPMLLPIVNHPRPEPFRIFARREVLELLYQHVFNGLIWPDFTQIPTPSTSQIRFCELAERVTVAVDDFSVTGVSVTHPTPTFGYLFESDQGGVAFTGDCHDSPMFWQTIAEHPAVSTVLVDLSFPSFYQEVADLSGHYTPTSLQRDLSRWPVSVDKPTIAISHLKPGYREDILHEVEALLGADWTLKVMKSGDEIPF